MERIPASLLLGVLRAVGIKKLVPLRLKSRSLSGELLVMFVDGGRNAEALGRIFPAEVFLERAQVFFAERFAVGARLAFFGGAAEADLRFDRDEGRPLLVCLRLFDRLADGGEIRTVLDRERLEAEGRHALFHVFGKGEVGAALDGNVVAVVEHDELVEGERACEREDFGGDALHHAAVAAEGKGVVIDDGEIRLVEDGGEVRFSNRHADCHAHAGAQRPCRSFHALRMAVLGMAGRQGAVLAEVLEVVERQPVAEEVQQGIEHGGAVPGGEDEAVAVRPVWILAVVLHVVRPEFVSDRGCAERQARMAGVRLLHGVRRKCTDRIHTGGVDIAHRFLLLEIVVC